ncbi:MAG: hypothetical protein ACTSQ8_19580 [Candidatus Helarchaeota archaeon]
MENQNSTKLEKLQSEISQLKKWNDAKAHELMEKDNLIKEQTKEINIFKQKIKELEQNMESTDALLAQKVNEIKKTETELIQYVQYHLSQIFKSIEAIQKEIIEKTDKYETILQDHIRELQNKELESFKAQVTLLNQKIKLLQMADFDLMLPEIIISPSEPIPISTKPATEEQPSQDLPTFTKIEKVKPVEKAEVKQRENPIYLHFDNNVFVKVRRPLDIGINLILDPKELKWILVWTSDASFVQRRTAERQARSIAKAGYSTETGRIGQGYPLELIGEKSIPLRLLRDQHAY